MKAIVLILTIFTQLFLIASERVAKHDNAVEELKNFNLFRKGKGMIIGPTTSYIAAFGMDRPLFKLIKDKSHLRNRWGAIQSDVNRFYGLNNNDYKGMKVMSLGCIFCHGGKAAGVYIPGLGNKNVDVKQIADDALFLQKFFDKGIGSLLKKEERKEVSKNAYEFAKVLANPKTSNLTQGLVPTSMIRQWFYKMEGKELPKDMRRGAVKVPHVWGYGQKRKVGQFSDGFGDGTFPTWGAAVEFAAGQDHETIRSYLDEVEHGEELFGELLPPKYPFNIKYERVKKGEALFVNNCMSCHGSYERDEQGLPIYKAPKHIPISYVKTDDDRLLANTKEFVDMVDNNVINDILKKTDLNDEKPGYFAPRLEGVWSRFPYLHNGSVPTIYDLLSPPEMRPKTFSLLDAGEKYRFDEEKMGLTKSKKKRSFFSKKKRYIYDTNKVGQSNKGHYFSLFQYFSHQDKLDIIEYLKTL